MSEGGSKGDWLDTPPPLIEAIQLGDEKKLITCIESGQNIHQEYCGCPPIWYATVSSHQKLSIVKILLIYGTRVDGYWNHLESFLKRHNQYDEDVIGCLDLLCSNPQVPNNLIQYRENLRAGLQEIRDKITKQIELGTPFPTEVIKQIILPYHVGFFSYQHMQPEKKEMNDPKPAWCVIL